MEGAIMNKKPPKRKPQFKNPLPIEKNTTDTSYRDEVLNQLHNFRKELEENKPSWYR